MSVCEAEIKATNEGVKAVLATNLLLEDIGLLSKHAVDVYNDNKGCVNWSKTTTTKRLKHMSLRENLVRESQSANVVDIQHIPGCINIADIFTKEHKDRSHFFCLCDSL